MKKITNFYNIVNRMAASRRDLIFIIKKQYDIAE